MSNNTRFLLVSGAQQERDNSITCNYSAQEFYNKLLNYLHGQVSSTASNMNQPLKHSTNLGRKPCHRSELTLHSN